MPATPGHNPKKTEKSPAGLYAVCLCEHQCLLFTHHFLLKVPVGIKVLCLEGVLGYLLFNGFSSLKGFLITVYQCRLTRHFLQIIINASEVREASRDLVW